MFMSTGLMRLTTAVRIFTARVAKPGAPCGTGIAATGCPICAPRFFQYCVNFARKSSLQRPSAYYGSCTVYPRPSAAFFPAISRCRFTGGLISNVYSSRLSGFAKPRRNKEPNTANGCGGLRWIVIHTLLLVDKVETGTHNRYAPDAARFQPSRLQQGLQTQIDIVVGPQVAIQRDAPVLEHLGAIRFGLFPCLQEPVLHSGQITQQDKH